MQVHMREMSPEGEEVIKTGKLYLVDLAGSENVNRQAPANSPCHKHAHVAVIQLAGRELCAFERNFCQSMLDLGLVLTTPVGNAPPRCKH